MEPSKLPEFNPERINEMLDFLEDDIIRFQDDYGRCKQVVL